MKVLEEIEVFRSDYQNYLDALYSVLSYYNEKTDVKELASIIGNDGMFEFHFSELWHDEASIYSRTEDLMGIISDYFGYDYEWYINKDFEFTWQKIKENINEGHPVITQSLGSESAQYRGEWMIICGYSEEGQEPIIILNGSGESYICTTFPERKEDTGDIEWGDHFPFQSITRDFYADKPLFIVKNKIKEKQTFDVRRAAFLNLKRIQRYAEKKYIGGKYKLWGGMKAMEKWKEFLNKLSDKDIERLLEDPSKFIVHFNARVPNFLIQSRKNTSFYLFEISTFFNKFVTQKLWKAAEHYSRVSELSLEYIDLLYCEKSSWEDEKFEKEILRGTERLQSIDYRKKAVELIGKIIQEEKSAVKHVKNAIAVIDEKSQ